MIEAPNYTQMPNVFLDDICRTLCEGELRIALVLCRQIFGWHKQEDKISLSQLVEKTGMQRKSVCRSLNSLLKKGLIEKRKSGTSGTEKCYYSFAVKKPPIEHLDHNDGVESKKEKRLISNNLDQCHKDTGTSDLKTLTKETLPKERKQQHVRQHNINKRTAETAAVFSNGDKRQEKKEENQTPKIHPILEDFPIPLSDKIEITKHYPKEEEVRHAVNWCLKSMDKINTTLQQKLKWACKNQPEITRTKEEIENDHKNETEKLLKENREYALPYHKKKSPLGRTTVYVNENHVLFQITQDQGFKTTNVIDFYQKDFKIKFDNNLKLTKIPPIKEQ